MEKKDAELRLFDSREELCSGLADYVHQISESAIKERGCFSIVLSGGDLPQQLMHLTKPPLMRMVEWSKWHVFWAEENVVAKNHPHRFYCQARDSFVSKVPILPAHIFPVSHGQPGESAAEAYEFTIRQQVRNRTVAVSPSSDCPRFDLILLNLGVHGHVASLYPNHSVLEEDSQWVVHAVIGGSIERVRFTLPVINAAANVAIVASGAEVAPPFLDAMMGRNRNESNPAQMIGPKDGKLVWLVDTNAASLFLHGRECPAPSGKLLKPEDYNSISCTNQVRLMDHVNADGFIE